MSGDSLAGYILMDITLFLRGVNIVLVFSHVSVPQSASGFTLQKKSDR